MQTEKIDVMNVTCGGCASKIKNGLKEMPGVTGVDVEIATGAVMVTGETLSRDTLTAKLAALGYPEKSGSLFGKIKNLFVPPKHCG